MSKKSIQFRLEDEGFDSDDFLDDIKHNLNVQVEFPTHFDLSAKTHKNTSYAGRRESYKDQDSVLHYFVATSQSETLLDQYMSSLIHCIS
jgi:hypothetical protein